VGISLGDTIGPPVVRAGTVPRTVVVERLLASPLLPVVAVVGPAGYGKTTVLAQWAHRTDRRVAWVSLDRGDNDLASLLAHIAAALDRAQLIEPAAFRTVAQPPDSVASAVAPRLASALSGMTRPVTLVFDQVERLENPHCRDVLTALATQPREDWQVVLASRGEPPLPMAALRSEGQLLELGVDDLALSEREAGALFALLDVELADPDLAELHRRTEGWPTGLYLAALALSRSPRPANGDLALAGNDRLVADYLRAELLSQVPESTVAFLTRTAVLDRLSGPLCDAVLDRTGSAAVLDSLDHSSFLLVPLDHRREWYRYHHLFLDLLRAELDQREPHLVPELHIRAADWCAANGRPESAIHHAAAAGDADRVARLVTQVAAGTSGHRRTDACLRWLTWFEDRGLVDRYPAVAVLGAVTYALLGQAPHAVRWAEAAEQAHQADGGGRLPDGSTLASWLALLRALLGRDGIAAMHQDASQARQGLAATNPWQATAALLEGVAHLLDGDPDQAEPLFLYAADAGELLGGASAAAFAVAERGLLAIDGDDWPQAEAHAARALALVAVADLGEDSASALVNTLAARVAIHDGDAREARELMASAARLRPGLTYAVPALAAQTLLEMARCYLALADTDSARTTLRAAKDVLQLRPKLGLLSEQARELGTRLDTIVLRVVGASMLTTAELRLLPFLPTHLSFREIGERLHVSRDTVKTQVASVYRKLGVTSRSEAIEQVHKVGLFG